MVLLFLSIRNFITNFYKPDTMSRKRDISKKKTGLDSRVSVTGLSPDIKRALPIYQKYAYDLFPASGREGKRDNEMVGYDSFRSLDPKQSTKHFKRETEPARYFKEESKHGQNALKNATNTIFSDLDKTESSTTLKTSRNNGMDGLCLGISTLDVGPKEAERRENLKPEYPRDGRRRAAGQEPNRFKVEMDSPITVDKKAGAGTVAIDHCGLDRNVNGQSPKKVNEWQTGLKHNIFPTMKSVKSRIKSKMWQLKPQSGGVSSGMAARSRRNSSKGHDLLDKRNRNSMEIELPYEPKNVESPPMGSEQVEGLKREFVDDGEMFVEKGMPSEIGHEVGPVYFGNAFHISCVANRGSATISTADLVREPGQQGRGPSFVELYEPVYAYGIGLPSCSSGSEGSSGTRQNLFNKYPENELVVEKMVNGKGEWKSDCKPGHGLEGDLKSNRKMSVTKNTLQRLRSFSMVRDEKEDEDKKVDLENVVNWCVEMTPSSYYDSKESKGSDGEDHKRTFMRRMSRSSRFGGDGEVDKSERRGFSLGRIRSRRRVGENQEGNKDLHVYKKMRSMSEGNGMESSEYLEMCKLGYDGVSRQGSCRTMRSVMSGRSGCSTATMSSKSSAGGHGTLVQRTVLRSKVNANGEEERERMNRITKQR